jgi:hypothetical protein
MSSQGEFDVTLRIFYGSDGDKEDDVETTLVVQPCSVLDVFLKYNLDLRSSDFKRRLEEMGGAPIEDLKQALKETWVAYQSFDGDAAVDGAAVELDAVVAGPSTLTLRKRVADKDAVLLVAYASETQIVDIKWAKLPLTAVVTVEHTSCFRFMMSLARQKGSMQPLSELRPGTLDFFVMSGYSQQDVTQATSSLIDDYTAGRFVPVDASAKVSEVVESQRGRRRCHVLLVHAARKGPLVSRDGAPKRALKAYTIFAWERRPALEKQGMSLGEIGPPRRPVEGAFLEREALISRR